MLRPAAYSRRLDLKRRGASLVLSLALVGAIVLALMKLGVLPAPEPRSDTEPNSFTLSPDPDPGPRAPAEAAERRGDAASPPKPAATVPVEPDPPPPPVPVPTPAPAPFPDMIILSSEQFARSDVRGKGSAEGRAGEGAGAGDSVAAYGPGEGPGGQRLFNAEWHREPSRAELAGYLPPSGAPPGSWAVIACRTIERYEVENCRSLGESPAGSGLARAMRQAAWQFRVRPPRVGGRSLVGEWVRIRITFDRAE